MVQAWGRWCPCQWENCSATIKQTLMGLRCPFKNELSWDYPFEIQAKEVWPGAGGEGGDTPVGERTAAPQVQTLQLGLAVTASFSPLILRHGSDYTNLTIDKQKIFSLTRKVHHFMDILCRRTFLLWTRKTLISKKYTVLTFRSLV